MLWIGFLAGFVFATLLFTVFAFTSSSNRLKKGFSNFKTELRIILFARTTVALEAAAKNNFLNPDPRALCKRRARITSNVRSVPPG